MAPGRSKAPRRRSDSPSTRGARNASSRPIGTFTKNTQRQLAYWTSRPPAIRPTAPPATLIAAYTPIARARGGPSGKVTAISDTAGGAVGMTGGARCRRRGGRADVAGELDAAAILASRVCAVSGDVADKTISLISGVTN